MRLLPLVLTAILSASGWLAAGDVPTLKSPLLDQSPPLGTALLALDLRNHFEITGIPGQVVRFNTGLGSFNVALSATSAPNTVANFVSYVTANRFSNTIVHRSDQSLQVIQGGGYLADTNLSRIALNAPIALETGDTLPNVRGSIAMARTSILDSATSEWFINTGDNSLNLPPASGGGYAVFGRVTGNGMGVVDTIANLIVLTGNATVNSSSTSDPLVTTSSLPPNFREGWVLMGSTVQSIVGNFITLSGNPNETITTPTVVPTSRFPDPFDQLPIVGAVRAGGSVRLEDLVTVNTATVMPVFPTQAGGPGFVQFTATSTNPSFANPQVAGSVLNTAINTSIPGSADIAITATDLDGNSVQDTFRIDVAGWRNFNNPYGWGYHTGGGWYWSAATSWIYLASDGKSAWSSDLMAWMWTDVGYTRIYSQPYGWLSPSSSGWFYSATLGWIVTGQYNGWVWASRIGWLIPNGDGHWFWTVSVTQGDVEVEWS